MTYYVKKVRKESVRTNSGGIHEHIVGVLTAANTYYSNKDVVDSIGASNDWFTDVEGEPKAKIRPLSYCPVSDCYHKPYITTDADSSRRNNLENLPRG
jgi:Protein of unknown function (DUF3892)